MAAEYSLQRTPKNADSDVLATSSPLVSNTGFSWFNHSAWCLTAAAQLTAIAFATMYYTPVYRDDIKVAMNGWWGADPNGPRDVWNLLKLDPPGSGHAEMVNMTYVLFLCAGPFFVGVIAYTLGGQLVTAPSRVGHAIFRTLRRKPTWVSLSYGEMLFVLLLTLGNAIVLGWYMKGKWDGLVKKGLHTNDSYVLEALAITLAMNARYTMMFMALPVTRHCYWMDMLNMSYAHGVKYHMWMGVLSLVFIVGHSIGFIVVHVMRDELHDMVLCFDCDLGKEGLMPWINFFGILATSSFIVLGITSIPFVRRHYYQVFKYTHYLFIPAVVFSIVHYYNNILWFYPAITLYIVNRIISQAHSNVPTEVVDVAALPNRVVRLVLRRSTAANGQFTPGAFAYLRVPAISTVQWHPFSISSSPAAHPDTFTIYVKDLGDWTSAFYDHAVVCQTANKLPVVYVDAFYGSKESEVAPHSNVVLVGGGIGVTPLIGMLEEVYESARHATVNRNVWLIWAARDLSLFKEFEPLFTKLRQFDPAGTVFRVKLFLTQAADGAALEYTANHAPLALATREFHPTAPLTAPRPFARALKSVPLQLAAFLTAFLVSWIVLMFSRWTFRIRGGNPANWPIQRIVEVVIIVVGAYVSYIVVGFEKATAPTAKANAASMYLHAHPNAAPATADFVHEFRVEDSRPDLTKLLDAINAEARDEAPIGVFVSGPKSLSDAVDTAARHVNHKRFDVHYEEFEL
ncbi:hypothetical protein H310_12944 [Aphanomyces invadans]|uniref:FAD-binding FR-type domain-containing protein n=1 Tax=Aphanomyces invadans TaxID=157072 RepID=A0A024TI05_9STRA|nr:hypothetical protein H310_12944 [Aphanomyces invadans]ETV92947.1 hypothetical protein H310_12944 [Aphanomyces invadans]|eukprot:XP_008878468.1 hypothetical protein H310_12944 [Aphanomyces invadans]